jgi:hypothetical protein
VVNLRISAFVDKVTGLATKSLGRQAERSPYKINRLQFTLEKPFS